MKYVTTKIYRKLARLARTLARNYTLAVLFHVVFPIIRLAGSKMVLEKPSAPSLWSEWNKKSESELISKQSGKCWVMGYLSWCYKSGNMWALFLLPFICILKATEESADMPSSESLLMYTLF